MYDLAALETELAGTIFAGKVRFAPLTESTNIDAMTAARAGAAHGSVWIADAQAAGRGRGGHAWQSAAGEGLYMSVLLRLDISAHRMALLPLAAGLAAAEAILAVTGLNADLRWPNDVLIDEHKVCGILVESSGGFAVVGVGINVHQRAFSEGLDTPATSLDLESGRRISRQALLVALLRSLQREAAALGDAAAAARILARLEQASSWVRGRSIDVHGPQACSGITAGLDENGFLRVETSTGLVVVQTGGIRAAGQI